MTTKQQWFVLVWLAVVSFLGIAMLIDEPTEEAAWVFGTPLGLLALWGGARWIEEWF